jgi:hypothetical protein
MSSQYDWPTPAESYQAKVVSGLEQKVRDLTEILSGVMASLPDDFIVSAEATIWWLNRQKEVENAMRAALRHGGKMKRK